MRQMKKLVVLAAIASSILIMLPGAVAAPVAGEVTGFVRYNGTELPLSGCATQVYSFSSVILNGTISSGSNIFAGALTTSNVKGNSDGCEDIDGGKGFVNTVSDQASFQSAGGMGSASGNFYGTYVRTSSVVTVNLTLTNVRINGVLVGESKILVTAQFTPYEVNPANGAIKAAAFSGTFQGV